MPHTAISISFYVAVGLAWAIGFLLMVLATRPSLAAANGCPVCMSRATFFVLFAMGVSGGAAVGFVAALLTAGRPQ
jgi:hypothetical protein